MPSLGVQSESVAAVRYGTLLAVVCAILHATAAFDFPPPFTDIAVSSNVQATATCTANGSGFTCNDTCPTRTAFPIGPYIFQNLNADCNNTIPSIATLPIHVATPKGKLQFNEFSDACQKHSINRDTSQFTLSVWIYVNCTNCTVLEMSPGIKFEIEASSILKVASVKQQIRPSTWHHLAIRNSETLSWFFDGKLVDILNATLTNSPTEFGPQQNLSSGEVVAFAEGQMFNQPLTSREVLSIRTGVFVVQDIPFPQCRCPDNAPDLVQATVPEQYLKCSDGRKNVSRLNPDAHPAIFMTDKDNNTYWNSGIVSQAMVSLTFGQLFQLSKITMTGLKTIPAEINIQLRRGLINSTLTFKSSCGSQADCISYNGDISTTKLFQHTFETNVTKRSDVEKFVANSVLVTFKAPTARMAFFTVSELQLTVRCHCYGHDRSCIVDAAHTSFTCNCDSASHTTAQYCEACKNEYYRNMQEDLSCPLQCGCNSLGSMNRTCEEVGGQCQCKSNVGTNGDRTCNTCKHNSINLGSDTANGCKGCNCNGVGITRCENNSSCTCKPNVETTSGTCNSCVDNFYDITRPEGCTPCECMKEGTQFGSICNKATGQCACKSNVQGRKCDQCKDGYYDLKNTYPTGCLDCECNFVGSKSLTCAKDDGQCPCLTEQPHNLKCTPTITEIVPNYGPMAGGTEISIRGHLLDNRAVSVTFTINDEHQNISSRSESLIVIRTVSLGSIGQFSMALVWSTQQKNDLADLSGRETFEYKTDPVITIPNGTFKTYASGGCSMDVYGTNLSNVYQPKLMVYDTNGKDDLKSVCTRIDNSHMVCKYPNVTSYVTSGRLAYGFWLDGVETFRKFDEQTTRIQVVEDPEIDAGKSITFKNTFDKEIKITGRNLMTACDARDVRVTVGDAECKIKEHTNEYIICDPEKKFPGRNDDAQLMVQFGNLVLHVGVVNFKSFWVLPEFIGIAVGVGVLVVSLLAIFIICKWRRHRGNFDNNDQPIETEMKPTVQKNDYTKWDVSSPISAGGATKTIDVPIITDYKKSFIERLEPSVSKVVANSVVDRSHIEPGQVCTHKGKNIRVISGKFSSCVSNPNAGDPIMIKTLISPYPDTGTLPQWLNDGLKESTRFQNALHDNVLRLLGISIDAKSVYILYPEMAKRTIKDYLLTTQTTFPNSQKLDMCVQVAEGMSYLASEGLVHRDLAARNCWLGEDDVVKIADTSFSYDIYPEDYLVQHGKHQPVRWMAPESLRQLGFYTNKTDMWSFGVLMWEVFTNGCVPYHEVKDTASIREYICDKGYRLGKPHDCPDNVFSVIKECHDDYSDARPTFPELMEKITQLISPSDMGGENLYQNFAFNQQPEDPEAGMEIYENTAVGKVPGVPSFPAPPRPPSKSKHY